VEKQKNGISCARAVTAILQTAKEKVGWQKIGEADVCYLGGASNLGCRATLMIPIPSCDDFDC